MFLVVRTPHKTVGPVSHKIWGLERLESPLSVLARVVSAIWGIRLDKPFGFLVLKQSGVRIVELIQKLLS